MKALKTVGMSFFNIILLLSTPIWGGWFLLIGGLVEKESRKEIVKLVRGQTRMW